MAGVARDQSMARRRISARVDRGGHFARRGVRRQTRWSRSWYFHAPVERRVVLAGRVGGGRLYPPNRSASRRTRLGRRTAQVRRTSYCCHRPQAATSRLFCRQPRALQLLRGGPDSCASPTSRLMVATTRLFRDRPDGSSRVSTRNPCTDSIPAASACLAVFFFFGPTY